MAGQRSCVISECDQRYTPVISGTFPCDLCGFPLPFPLLSLICSLQSSLGEGLPSSWSPLCISDCGHVTPCGTWLCAALRPGTEHTESRASASGEYPVKPLFVSSKTACHSCRIFNEFSWLWVTADILLVPSVTDDRAGDRLMTE